MKTPVKLLAISCFLTSICQSTFAQGSLTPPGAPTPTMKSLAQIEPRTPINSLPYAINLSGSYYVATNLSGATGITIAASDVTLDLNGFSIRGPGTSVPGILISGSQQSIVIRNGIVTSWGTAIEGGSAYQSVFEDLRVASNVATGIVTAARATVRGCVVTGAGSGGIVTGLDSLVTGCIVSQNGFNGSFRGISVGDGSSVLGCITGENTSDGIFAGNHCVIKDCTTHRNLGGGIVTALGCTVSSCSSITNSGDGIRVSSNCLVAGNHADLNGGSDIHATGAKNRIEGNTTGGKGTIPTRNGIRTDVATNLIVRNSFTFAGFNSGDLIGDAHFNDAQINSNKNPWANFVY